MPASPLISIKTAGAAMWIPSTPMEDGMNMLGRIRVAAAAMVIVVLAGGAVSAAPLLPSRISTISEAVPDGVPVRWRGHRGGGAGVAAGLAAGLIIGGLLTAPRYYDEPYPYYGYYPPRYVGPIGYGAPGWEAYCFSRYRSFDPVSGTYLRRNGRRYYCR
jgi:MFS family permease